MKVHLRNKDFWISWNYKQDPITFCHIRCGDEVVGMAEVTRHPKDKHVKEIARKESLARAMKNAGFDKQEREEVWIQYFSRNDEQMERQLVELLKQIA